MEVDDGSKKIELRFYNCLVSSQFPDKIGTILSEVANDPIKECRYLIMDAGLIQKDALDAIWNEASGKEISERSKEAISLYLIIKSIIELLGGAIMEVNVFDVVDGCFLTNLIINEQEIGISPSDGITIATVSGAPIFTNEKLLFEYGCILRNGEFVALKTPASQERLSVRAVESESIMEKLERELNEAVKNEDYETAAKLRDQIEELKNNPEK